MKKLTFIIISLLLLAGCSAAGPGNAAGNKPIKITENNPAENISLTDSKNGISAEIENVQRENGKTIVNVNFNNHQYDLSSMDIKGLSLLDNKKPSDFEITSKLMGGHHMSAKMTFEGELHGTLIIGLREDLSLHFDLS